MAIRIRFNLIASALLAISPNAIAGTTYYISPKGADQNAGTSADAPLKSLSWIQKLNLKAGDRILLEGGKEFVGTIRLDPSHVAGPIEISTYGSKEKAKLVSKEGPAILAKNLGGLSISHIQAEGPGSLNNTFNGISIVNERKEQTLSNIRIDDVEVSNFGHMGISVSSQGKSGFKNIRISKAIAHDNGWTGIEVAAPFPTSGYPHENLTLVDSVAYRNRGRPGVDAPTGNGIVISGVRRALIEHCEAYENGGLCTSRTTGGPAGIWAYNSDQVIAQFNKSHHNHSGNTADGGGFDIDGSMTNSVFRYNLAYENDGYGFQFCDFGASAWGAPEFDKNSFQNNISLLDGSTHGVGAILVNGPVNRSIISKNIVFSRKAPNGKKPYSVQFDGWPGKDIRVTDNFFYSDGDASFVDLRESSRSQGAYLDENDYWTAGTIQPVHWNEATYTDLEEWRKKVLQDLRSTIRTGTRLPIDHFDLRSKVRLEKADFERVEDRVKLIKAVLKVPVAAPEPQRKQKPCP